MLFGPVRRAVVLAPHTDDEFACSGTMARLAEAGVDLHFVCFSPCEESVPPGFDKDVLRREVTEAARLTGLDAQHFRLLEYRVRHFPAHRQEILEDLVRLRRELDPDLVLLPATSDIHQDHQVIAQEGLRAFKHSTVLGYEHPQNTISFDHACFIALEESHLRHKLAHAAVYRSQADRPYLRPEIIRGLAAVRGMQINRPAAEAFQVLRLSII